MKIKEKIFKKFMEKPLYDVLFVTYELYEMSCRVYLDSNQIPNFEDYCKYVNENLKKLNEGGNS